MNKTIEFSINKKNNGERLDVFLSKEIKNLTRSYIKKLIEKKNVRLNKSIKTSPSTKIKTNDKNAGKGRNRLGWRHRVGVRFPTTPKLLPF